MEKRGKGSFIFCIAMIIAALTLTSVGAGLCYLEYRREFEVDEMRGTKTDVIKCLLPGDWIRTSYTGETGCFSSCMTAWDWAERGHPVKRVESAPEACDLLDGTSTEQSPSALEGWLMHNALPGS